MIGEYERYGKLDYKKFDPQALEKFASGVTDQLLNFSKYITESCNSLGEMVPNERLRG